jgi:hypothetical protein
MLGLGVVEEWPKPVSQAYMDRVSAEMEQAEQAWKEGQG